mgnify:CR=1 FL=1
MTNSINYHIMENTTPKLGIIESDPWLEPYSAAIEGRHQHAIDKELELTNGKSTLSDFATGYLYFGLHRTKRGWVFREWKEIYIIGDFNGWKENGDYRMYRVKNSPGVWEVELNPNAVKHGDLYKLKVRWNGGEGERIPAWATRVVQDEQTKIFSAQVWAPEKPYKFRKKVFRAKIDPLMIYECHIGMAQNEEKVGTYNEFREKILPRVAADGYNCIQIMAIQEHPYYGSFGYHVSSFFAPSSRFGTPEELKELIDTAHRMGIAVIMDIVHSHAVKNEVEGLGNFAGDPNQYFYPGVRREHPAWDSLCFDYGKNEVIHFLLSNCKYWLEEFHFDGFRFDGVTSMLYYSHGLGEAFCNYGDYFNGNQDDNAICYLTLANKLIHQVNSKAITIAEEVSGMPGLAAPYQDGGYGFDYRMAMNIPDYWIKTIKEKIDEDWKPSSMFWEVTNRRKDATAATWIYFDEIHVLLKDPMSSNFLYSSWKRFRKYNAYATGISQDIQDYLDNPVAYALLSNSEFVIMLRQSKSLEALERLYGLSKPQLEFLHNASEGHGILKMGNSMIPFSNLEPKDTAVYKLITTKPGEATAEK